MLTTMTEEDWSIVLKVFEASRSRRGDKGWDDRGFLEALQYFVVQTYLACSPGNVWALEQRLEAVQGGLVGGACALEQARSLREALRVILGRRHPCAGPALRGRRAVPAGHHRRHARGQEGVGRPNRRRARECAILERRGTWPRPPRRAGVASMVAFSCRKSSSV
jgi:hypothetical protein